MPEEPTVLAGDGVEEEEAGAGEACCALLTAGPENMAKRITQCNEMQQQKAWVMSCGEAWCVNAMIKHTGITAAHYNDAGEMVSAESRTVIKCKQSGEK